jgi:hypothetical protein
MDASCLTWKCKQRGLGVGGRVTSVEWLQRLYPTLQLVLACQEEAVHCSTVKGGIDSVSSFTVEASIACPLRCSAGVLEPVRVVTEQQPDHELSADSMWTAAGHVDFLRLCRWHVPLTTVLAAFVLLSMWVCVQVPRSAGVCGVRAV